MQIEIRHIQSARPAKNAIAKTFTCGCAKSVFACVGLPTYSSTPKDSLLGVTTKKYDGNQHLWFKTPGLVGSDTGKRKL